MLQAPPHHVLSHSISFSPALFIYLYICLHRPYSFDIPLDIWIPGRNTIASEVPVTEQEQPIASEGPVTAPITSVDARNEMQPVDIVVPGRPDADHSGYTATRIAGTGFVTGTMAMAAKSTPREEDRVARTGGVSHLTWTKHQQQVEQQL